MQIEDQLGEAAAGRMRFQVIRTHTARAPYQKSPASWQRSRSSNRSQARRAVPITDPRPLFRTLDPAHHRFPDTAETDMASGLLKDIKLALGEIFSSGKIDENQQVTLQVVFGLLGYLARADSIVTDDEAAFLNNLMDDMSLSLAARKIAVDAMNRGKARQIDIAVELERFLSVHPAGSAEVGRLYETLLKLAGSDGRVRPREREFLEQVTAGLGYTQDILDTRLQAMARQPIA